MEEKRESDWLCKVGLHYFVRMKNHLLALRLVNFQKCWSCEFVTVATGPIHNGHWTPDQIRPAPDPGGIHNLMGEAHSLVEEMHSLMGEVHSLMGEETHSLTVEFTV